MYELKPEEKSTPVIAYTEGALFHGQIVTRDIVRVNILMRTEGAPSFVHLLNAQMIWLDNAAKATKFDEIFIPANEVIAFHVAPGIENEADYDEGEENRMMIQAKVTVGSFFVECKLRISSQTDLSTSLEVSRTAWLSLYEANITNLYLPKMNVQTPMLLVRPERVTFGLMG